MSFNTANILRGKYGSSNGPDEITIDHKDAGIDIPDHYWVTEADDEKPLYKLVYRPQFGYHLAPVAENPEGMLGPMFDGNYAAISWEIKKALEKKLGHPYTDVLHVHDRYETQETYDLLSR
tara:strand:+ start:295 stop:657 length:363 start_codon:yes stop_codon:yes gene_type:complete